MALSVVAICILHGWKVLVRAVRLHDYLWLHCLIDDIEHMIFDLFNFILFFLLRFPSEGVICTIIKPMPAASMPLIICANF